MNNVDENIQRELYLLIAKFLSKGPCSRATEALTEELVEHKLLRRRTDWRGQEHDQTYEETIAENRHIPDDFLLRVAERLVPLVEQCVPGSAPGFRSLLGAGRQSMLRTSSETNTPSVSSLAVCHHGAPLLPPVKRRIPGNIGQVLCSREISGTSSIRNVAQPNLYTKLSMHRRILGHLSAVYCVLFDRSGECIITGADDSLVKIWSSEDGRLLATLRGHQAEISDIAVNYENNLIAAGSCDKVIRVWSLKSTQPIAVLQGHTGMITSLQFCPSPLNESRYLVSTGGDGTVCFWKWDLSTLKFEPKPIRFIEKSRPGTQMVCSSFSPGGSFLVSGSTDHIIRIYQMTPGPPERIAELDVHNDHVDSIQFSHKGDRFLSGSRDGTARIWYFHRSAWKHILVDVSKRLPGSPLVEESVRALKPRVTMVGWDLWDQHVITAVNDNTLKVWEAATGNLSLVLSGHQDEVFVLEAHPTDPRILLSAGHDGYVILWDLRIGEKITSFYNSLEGQGHGAVFDCKFSSDGLKFACTDSHGHLCIFGYGSSDRYSRVPSEQFFHTDYRPLIRDSNNYVLDEQTQTDPHLMPPPFLVDVDGNPHPIHFQRLVPGHGSNVRGPPRPAPQPPPTPREDVPPLLAEIEAAEAAEAHGRLPLPALQSPPPHGQGPVPPLQSPGGSRNQGMRQMGDVEGVRLVHGNIPVIQDVSDADISAWRNRRIVPPRKPSVAKCGEERRLLLGREEMLHYLREKKRRALPSTSKRITVQVPETRPVEERPNQAARRTSNRRTAGQHSRGTRRPAYSTRAAAALDVEESAEEEAAATPSDTEEEDDEEEWSESSSESSEYSDWTEEVGLRTQQQTENRRPRRVCRVLSTSDEEGAEPSSETAAQPGPSSPQRQSKAKKESKKSKKPTKKKRPSKKPKVDEVQELLTLYQPPDWLTCTVNRISPYVPQLGDEVYYLRQGHELYVKEVMATKCYDINPKKQCYYKLRLKAEELCRIVSLHYSAGPPTLCCLKLALINPETGSSTGATFTVKYHDMPDVLDFLILRQTYDQSISRNWRPGDRFRSVIDETWWAGEITDRSPFQTEFVESHFQCFTVTWDTGEVERMSPWDLQPVTERDPGNPDLSAQDTDASGAATSNIPLTDEERLLLAYEPEDSDWLGEGRDAMTERLVAGLEALSQLNFAGPFVYPVDVHAYPDYWTVVPYPTDLSNLREKLLNKYYRRVAALQWEVKQLEKNARLYNEEESQIVRNSSKLVSVLNTFIRDSSCNDILSLCGDEEAIEGDVEVKVDNMSEESADEGDTSQDSGVSGSRKRKRESSSERPNKQIKREQPPSPPVEPWLQSAHELLDFLVSREDATPFRHPVDLNEWPDYTDVVAEPMDFSTVYQRLENNLYEDPEAFVRDVRLIFSNSRAYNTIPRSRIYSMTIRLSAMFEDRVDSVLRDWYESASGGARRTRLRTMRLLESHAPISSGASRQRMPHSGDHAASSSSRASSSGLDPSFEAVNTRENRTRSLATRAATTSELDQRNGQRYPSRTETRSSSRANPQSRHERDDDNVFDNDGLSGIGRSTRSTRSSARRELVMRIPTSRIQQSIEEEAVSNGPVTSRYATRRTSSLAQSSTSVNEEESDEDECEEEGEEDEEDEEEGGGSEEGEEQGDDSEEEGDEDEEEEDDEDEDEEEESEDSADESRPQTRRKAARPTHRPTVTVRTNRLAAKTSNTRTSRSKPSASSTQRRTSETSETSHRNDNAPCRRSLRRNSSVRRVRYNENDSDSESDSAGNEIIRVSSRGRIRKPAIRMQDYVE
ncbi:PH-interacting protein-like [Porites lutea]|uniref:PH-interacting protein-like n=1 Tax=Porites lutea TaxID=51062 RepID=UPI003CC64BAB